MTTTEHKRLAQWAIDTDHALIYDVASNVGQIVGNVKHMTWFLDAVAEHIGDLDRASMRRALRAIRG